MIEARNLVKTFKNGDVETHVLRRINLTVCNGEWIAIMGRSGAGKSTLMYQMSLLDSPTSGEILIDDKVVSNLTEKEKNRMRLYEFGYVFQDYALVPELTALENVVLPLLMERYTQESAETKAAEALRKVGLDKRLHSLPSRLSGGEQQRVSIARAIAEAPEILFADEPTANLDRESSKTVMDIFAELNKNGQTIIMVTHEEEYGRLAGRIVRLDDGAIIDTQSKK